MDEFQEADILWPDTAPTSRQEEALLLPPEAHELAAAGAGSSTSSCSGSGGFLSGAALSKAGASPVAADAAEEDEELQEVDVLWPDTCTARLADESRGGAGGCGRWFRVDLARGSGRRAKPAAGGGGGVLSSPIDIPARVAARCR